jgi:hypothetical protein
MARCVVAAACPHENHVAFLHPDRRRGAGILEIGDRHLVPVIECRHPFEACDIEHEAAADNRRNRLHPVDAPASLCPNLCRAMSTVDPSLGLNVYECVDMRARIGVPMITSSANVTGASCPPVLSGVAENAARTERRRPASPAACARRSRAQGRSVAEREVLAQAVLERRPEDAAQLMRNHLRLSREWIETV